MVSKAPNWMKNRKRGRALTRGLTVSRSILVRMFWVYAISCLFLISHVEVSGAERIDPNVKSETETQDKKMQSQPWEPPPPPPDGFDWIQLNSGEWLKGELKRLYQRKLEFDSDKLGLLEFDWEDVKEVRGQRVFGVRFEGPISVDGLLQVTENKVIVTVGEKEREFRRDRLISIAPGGEREIDYWSGKLSIGLDFTRGNTDQTQYSSIAKINRRTSGTRLAVDYLGNFSRTEGVETINNQRVGGSFDIFKTRNYYYRPFFGEYFRDPIKNIEHRITLGAGLGYHIINTPKTEWEVSGGPAFQTTRFVSTGEGEDSSESTSALVAGTHFNRELTKRVDFDFRYDVQIVNEASGNYTHHFVVAVETEITRWLDFDVSLVWDRTKDPTPEADGTVPKPDDFYLIFGLGIEF